jgi:hypothetical protein
MPKRALNQVAMLIGQRQQPLAAAHPHAWHSTAKIPNKFQHHTISLVATVNP